MIVNPVNNQMYRIHSIKGRELLKIYIDNYRGMKRKIIQQTMRRVNANVMPRGDGKIYGSKFYKRKMNIDLKLMN